MSELEKLESEAERLRKIQEQVESDFRAAREAAIRDVEARWAARRDLVTRQALAAREAADAAQVMA